MWKSDNIYENTCVWVSHSATNQKHQIASPLWSLTFAEGCTAPAAGKCVWIVLLPFCPTVQWFSSFTIVVCQRFFRLLLRFLFIFIDLTSGLYTVVVVAVCSVCVCVCVAHIHWQARAHTQAHQHVPYTDARQHQYLEALATSPMSRAIWKKEKKRKRKRMKRNLTKNKNLFKF